LQLRQVSVVLALLLLLMPGAGWAGTLDGPWRVHAGGDERLAAVGVDDTRWPVITLPAQLPEGGWLRRKVKLGGTDLPIGQPLALLLPADVMYVRGHALYVDGVRIGGAGTPGALLAPAAAPALHRVPPAAADDGELVLALHIGPGAPPSGGWLLGPVAALEGPFTRARLAQLEAVFPDLFGTGFFTFVMLCHLEMFRRRPAARANLWFALVCAGALGINLSGMAIQLAPRRVPMELMWRTNPLSGATAMVSLLRFTWTLIERPRPRWVRALGWLIAGIGGLASAFIDLYRLAGATWVLALVAAGVAICVAAWRGHREARVVAVGMAVFVTLLAVSIVDTSTAQALPGWLPLLAFASLVLAMALSLSGRFARSYQEIEVLNQELRRQVAERARDLSGALAGLSGGARKASPAGTEVLEGRYRIIRLLGMGGMGWVYEAEAAGLERRVALKRLRHVAGPAAQARLAREAQLAARLHHPNLVSVIDVGLNAQGVYLVMELVPGTTLEAQRPRFGDAAFARPILAQVAAGLAYMHGEGVAHRDLKPSNILLADSAAGGPPVARISDFGIAGLFAGEADVTEMATSPPPGATGHEPGLAPSAPGLTAPGTILGTFPYMAPEQATGARAEPAADVFAFGVIAHELLTGLPPFVPPAARQVRAGGVPVLARQLAAGPARLAPATAALLDRCLALAPAERPTANELASALALSGP
jgi:hypothetical protein